MRRATVTPDGWVVAKLPDGWWVLRRTAPLPTMLEHAQLLLRGEFHITEWRQQCGPYARRYDAAQYALRKARRLTTQGVQHGDGLRSLDGRTGSLACKRIAYKRPGTDVR